MTDFPANPGLGMVPERVVGEETIYWGLKGRDKAFPVVVWGRKVGFGPDIASFRSEVGPGAPSKNPP